MIPVDVRARTWEGREEAGGWGEEDRDEEDEAEELEAVGMMMEEAAAEKTLRFPWGA